VVAVCGQVSIHLLMLSIKMVEMMRVMQVTMVQMVALLNEITGRRMVRARRVSVHIKSKVVHIAISLGDQIYICLLS